MPAYIADIQAVDIGVVFHHVEFRVADKRQGFIYGAAITEEAV